MHKLDREIGKALLTAHEGRFPFGATAHVVAVLVLCAVLAGVTVAWYL